MSSQMPNITALTSDYDAIERAIRETTRGRWFLNCYLQRNRSAETRVLLDAIARLEAAMRDSGHMVDALAPAEALAKIAETLADAREDIARMVSDDAATVTLPVKRFSFGSIPRSARAATHAMRDAAVEIDKAAGALRDAGVFHGVAKSISEKAEEIIRACAVQEQSIGQMQRVSMLIADVEAEIISVMESRQEADVTGTPPSAELHRIHERSEAACRIPELVMAELSEALSQRGAGESDEDVILPEPA
jgi:hypothetical protein